MALAMGLLAAVACAGSAPEPAPAPAVAPELAKWPPELNDVATRINLLCEARRFGEARTICQQGYDATTDTEARAFYLRSIGMAYDNEKDYDRAIETYQQVIAQYPQTTQAPWAQYYIAAVYAQRGKERNGAEDLTTAIPLLEGFLKEHPNHLWAGRAMQILGRCHEGLGDDQGALNTYLRAVEIYPEHAFTNSCLARAIELLLKLERWDEALAAAHRYGELYAGRDPAAAQLYLAFCYAGQGDTTRAQVEFDRAAAQNAGELYLTVSAWLRLAESLGPQGRYDDLFVRYAAFIDAGRDARPTGSEATDYRPLALRGLAEAYMMRGDREQAIARLERVVAEYPGSQEGRGAYSALADCYGSVGRYDKALAALQAAIARYPGTPTAAGAQWGVGQLLREQGKLGEAKLAYQRLISDFAAVAGCESLLDSARTVLAALDGAAPHTEEEGQVK
jgi:tetratricopeptide (TPR) repeat protein